MGGKRSRQATIAGRGVAVERRGLLEGWTPGGAVRRRWAGQGRVLCPTKNVVQPHLFATSEPWYREEPVSDTRTIVVSVIGTGIAVVTVVVGFMAIIASGIDARFDDVNARISDVNTRIDELSRSVNARFEDVNARFDDLNARVAALEIDVRELRGLVIDAIRDVEPAID